MKLLDQASVRKFCDAAAPCIVAIGSLLLIASPTRAQQPSTLQQGPSGAIRVEVSLVLVEATLKDRSGKIMGGLKPEDFEIREDGVLQTVSHLSRDQLPLAVAMVVDLSESITPFIRPLRYATQSALKALKPEDEVALFTFSDQVDRRVDLTLDKRDIADQIESFSTGGATNINQAIFEAARYLRTEAPAERRVIVLVSDNVATAESDEGQKQVLDQVLAADAAVYSLKVPGENPLGARMMSKTNRGLVNVAKLADETGGEVFEVEKEGSLFLAFQALIERLKTRYTLGYYSTNRNENGDLRRLEISLQPRFGKKNRDYKVISKSGYYGPKR